MTNHLRQWIFGIAVVALALAAVMNTAQAANVLSLDEYLGSVRDGNEAVRSAFTASEGAQATAADAELLTTPQLFGSAASTRDERFNPQFRANKVINDSYQLGLQKQTAYGLGAKLYYSLSTTDVPGVLPKFHEARPTLELSQQLWRNGFGSETRAQIEALDAGARAKSEAEAFRGHSLLLEAELAYWRLALARETVSVQEDALKRADRLVDWANRRAKMGLADRADSLQARANHQARKLDLRSAIDSERAAARAFNSARGRDANRVEETLQPLTTEVIERMRVPQDHGTRGDLKAAALQTRAAAANARASAEKSRPSVEIFGTFAANGFDFNRNDAIDQSFTNERPTTTVGLRFSVPLDFSAASRSQEGYRKEALAAESTYRRKVFEESRDWQDVTQRLEEAKDRLRLYQELERDQRAKLEHERGRHERGRSTTQQVLLYELDYAQAQFGRIRTLAEILQLNAQMKLYGVTP